jgi:hypothetical protein
MRGLWVRIAGGALCTIYAAAMLAAPTSIVTKPLACIAKDRNARITARIEGRVKSARVYFNAVDPKCDEYFLEMHQSPLDPTLYWAMLPLVLQETHIVSYQVRVDPGPGEKPVVSAPLTVPVRDGCTADPLSESEQRAADNLILGLTSPGQSGVPCGFRCEGIKSILTTGNELRPNDACFRLLAANKPWYLTPGGKTALGTAAALGGVYLWNRNHQDDKPASPARPSP